MPSEFCIAKRGERFWPQLCTFCTVHMSGFHVVGLKSLDTTCMQRVTFIRVSASLLEGDVVDECWQAHTRPWELVIHARQRVHQTHYSGLIKRGSMRPPRATRSKAGVCPGHLLTTPSRMTCTPTVLTTHSRAGQLAFSGKRYSQLIEDIDT